jgi:hypothetical protein
MDDSHTWALPLRNSRTVNGLAALPPPSQVRPTSAATAVPQLHRTVAHGTASAHPLQGQTRPLAAVPSLP